MIAVNERADLPMQQRKNDKTTTTTDKLPRLRTAICRTTDNKRRPIIALRTAPHDHHQRPTTKAIERTTRRRTRQSQNKHGEEEKNGLDNNTA
jgi:hypothetical protein